MRIAVLMTCHNRRETTVSCLRGLFAQVNEDFAVYLVDDGSTDGTREAVLEMSGRGECERKRGRIHFIQGDGNLFWAKGMALAWSTSLTESWDGWLLLNDDTQLRDDAIARLLKSLVDDPDAVIVGNLQDEVSGRKTCGLAPDGTFTGNFLYVPKTVYQRVGAFCGDFSHAWADCDYAMRCRRQKVRVVELDDVGTTHAHAMRPSLAGMNWRARWRTLRDPKGWCVHDIWLYRRRNWGFWVAVISCVHLVIHVMLGERFVRAK